MESDIHPAPSVTRREPCLPRENRDIPILKPANQLADTARHPQRLDPLGCFRVFAIRKDDVGRRFGLPGKSSRPLVSSCVSIPGAGPANVVFTMPSNSGRLR